MIEPPENQPIAAEMPVCTASRLLVEWLRIGGQSFGGGSMTLILMRQTFVERTCWVKASEFDRFFSLVQIVPGINLLALAILLGRKVLGWRGILISLLGLLVPSVTITALLTALYVHVQNTEIAKDALRGFLPATVGLGLLTAYQMARTNLIAAQKEGRFSLAISLMVLAGCCVAVGKFGMAVLPVLLLAGVLEAAVMLIRHRKSSTGSALP